MFEKLFQRKNPGAVAEAITPERKESFLSDLNDVGSRKAIGYLPIESLTKIYGLNPNQIKADLEQKGLKVIIMKSAETNVAGGAIYAYDESMLHQLIENNSSVLEETKWPTDPELFVRNLNNTADRKTKLFDVIADAFGDKSNIGRTDVESEAEIKK